MSQITRRKHVLGEMHNDDFEHPNEKQQIVRVVKSRGNNLHEVESSELHDSDTFLVSMPNKFRKNVWVKRGDYILVEAIEEGSKVKAEIAKILTKEHIKEYKKAGIWPKKFTTESSTQQDMYADIDVDNDKFVVRNHNRPLVLESEDGSDDDDSTDCDTEDTNSN